VTQRASRRSVTLRRGVRALAEKTGQSKKNRIETRKAPSVVLGKQPWRRRPGKGGQRGGDLQPGGSQSRGGIKEVKKGEGSELALCRQVLLEAGLLAKAAYVEKKYEKGGGVVKRKRRRPRARKGP